MNSLFVEGGGHLGCLGHVPAVHQPEPGANLGEKHSHSSEQLEGGVNTYRGGEVDAVVDEGEGGAARDILPLGTRGPACNTSISNLLLLTWPVGSPKISQSRRRPLLGPSPG